METHVGTALVPVKPWSRAEIVVDLVDGYIVIWTTDGKWLGSLPATDVAVESVHRDRATLVLNKEKVSFETQDPVGLARAIDRETRRILEMSIVERLAQACRTKALCVVNRSHTLAIWLEQGSTARGQQSDETTRGQAIQPKRSSIIRVGGENRDLVPDLLEPAQQKVVDALASGMRAWFGFYFRTAQTTGEERIYSAVGGLRDAARGMREVFDGLGNAGDLDASSKEFVEDYREAIEGWADAMDSIALGLELDQQHTADRGFAQLLRACDRAEELIVQGSLAEETLVLKEPLVYLDGLEPPGKITKKAVKQAKEPWRRSIISAGSPFRTV